MRNNFFKTKHYFVVMSNLSMKRIKTFCYPCKWIWYFKVCLAVKV